MIHVIRKYAFCICENKDADDTVCFIAQLISTMCFRHKSSAIAPLLKTYDFLLRLYRPVCVGPGRQLHTVTRLYYSVLFIFNKTYHEFN